MIHQHRPGRFRVITMRNRRIAVGTIPVGTIARHPGNCNDPIIVEAWLPREIGASRRNAAGKWENTFASGGHLAQVRSLRTGLRFRLSDVWLLDQEG